MKDKTAAAPTPLQDYLRELDAEIRRQKKLELQVPREQPITNQQRLQLRSAELLRQFDKEDSKYKVAPRAKPERVSYVRVSKPPYDGLQADSDSAAWERESAKLTISDVALDRVISAVGLTVDADKEAALRAVLGTLASEVVHRAFNGSPLKKDKHIERMLNYRRKWRKGSLAASEDLAAFLASTSGLGDFAPPPLPERVKSPAGDADTNAAELDRYHKEMARFDSWLADEAIAAGISAAFIAERLSPEVYDQSRAKADVVAATVVGIRTRLRETDKSKGGRQDRFGARPLTEKVLCVFYMLFGVDPDFSQSNERLCSPRSESRVPTFENGAAVRFVTAFYAECESVVAGLADPKSRGREQAWHARDIRGYAEHVKIVLLDRSEEARKETAISQRLQLEALAIWKRWTLPPALADGSRVPDGLLVRATSI